MPLEPVTLNAVGRASWAGPIPLLREVAERAGAVAEGAGPSGPAPDLDRALGLARSLGRLLPHPGTGDTAVLWSALATLGAADLTLARVVEPHLDALAILDQAAHDDTAAPPDLVEDAAYGVFAAEGAGRLVGQRHDGAWVLQGHKPWCSLADRLDRALVTAWLDEHERGLFLVDLGSPGVSTSSAAAPWVSRGLAQVRSTGLDLDAVPAMPVGGPGWYLHRPGFAWGGIGVAAIWYGATVALARRLREAALSREPDQIALAHLGAVDVALTRARAVLAQAAAVVDGPTVSSDEASRLALRARHVVADAAEETLTRVGHALGPGPLALEEEHARRVVDLGVYLRQHHAERDAAALGHSVTQPVAEREWSWW